MDDVERMYRHLVRTIQSTSPQDFIANGGSANIFEGGRATLHWPEAIRAAYQAAWNSPRNELLIAWVRAHMSKREVKKAE